MYVNRAFSFFICWLLMGIVLWFELPWGLTWLLLGLLYLLFVRVIANPHV